MTPLFTVVIPTRNRPVLFKAALDSVLAQQDAALEVVVINDGSDAAHLDAYRALEAAADPRVRFFALPREGRGHGQSYALNYGAALGRGGYVAFLDDDDAWTDPHYLARTARTIAASATPVDLHLANQIAFMGDAPMGRVTWIEDLAAKLAGAPADAEGAITVTPAQLLRSHGFGHLNTSIVSAAFFAARTPSAWYCLPTMISQMRPTSSEIEGVLSPWKEGAAMKTCVVSVPKSVFPV